MRVNINDFVRVKLTKRGREIMERWSLDTSGSDARTKFVEPSGWTSWQMWELMKVFGPHLAMHEESPFDSNIISIPEK